MKEIKIIIDEKISNEELRSFLENPFPEMIKFVVDLEKEIIALGGEMHSDAEEMLIKQGSSQKNLWGGNIYPDREEKIEYSSLINIRPSENNKGMEVKDEATRQRIKEIVRKLISL